MYKLSILPSRQIAIEGLKNNIRATSQGIALMLFCWLSTWFCRLGCRSLINSLYFFRNNMLCDHYYDVIYYGRHFKYLHYQKLWCYFALRKWWRQQTSDVTRYKVPVQEVLHSSLSKNKRKFKSRITVLSFKQHFLAFSKKRLNTSIDFSTFYLRLCEFNTHLPFHMIQTDLWAWDLMTNIGSL